MAGDNRLTIGMAGRTPREERQCRPSQPLILRVQEFGGNL